MKILSARVWTLLAFALVALLPGMREPYQLGMSGAITAREAARRMQREAEKTLRIAISDQLEITMARSPSEE